MDAEERYRLEPVDELSPDRLYDRRWAMTVIAQAMDRLRAECVANGKGDLFDRLAGLLSGERSEARHRELGATMGLSEGALKVAVHRLRRRFGELVREEIAQTVGTAEDVGDEVSFLRAVLRE